MSPRVPEKKAPRAKRLGAPDPLILSGPLSREKTDTPPRGSGAATCPQVAARARAAATLSREGSPTYRIQYGRRKCALL